MIGDLGNSYYVASGISQYLGSVVANFASVPTDIKDPLVSLPIYTALSNKLGFAGVACTVIALAMLPLMKKLSCSHSVSIASDPLPLVRSEEFNTPS